MEGFSPSSCECGSTGILFRHLNTLDGRRKSKGTAK